MNQGDMLLALQVHLRVSRDSNNITYPSCSSSLVAYTRYLEHYVTTTWDPDEVLLRIFRKCLQVSETPTSGHGSFPEVLRGPLSACSAYRQIKRSHYVKAKQEFVRCYSVMISKFKMDIIHVNVREYFH
jgi:hypothetical protein